MFDALSLPLGAITQNWLMVWLTPLWYLAVGIAMGLAALAVFVVITRILSTIPVWADLSKSAAGHVVAGILTLGLAGAAWFLVPAETWGDRELNEPLLLGLATLLISGIVGWAFVFSSAPRAAASSFATLTEGAAGYLVLCGGILICICGGAWALNAAVPSPIIANPGAAFASIPQVFNTGTSTFTRTVPGIEDGDRPYVPVELSIDFDLLEEFSITSDRSVSLADATDVLDFIRPEIPLGANETLRWTKQQKISELPIPYEEGSVLHVQNKEIDAATLTFTMRTTPPVPEAASFLIRGGLSDRSDVPSAEWSCSQGGGRRTCYGQE